MAEPESADLTVRQAGVDEIPAVAQMLHDFNVEFDEPAPHPDQLAERLRLLFRQGDTTVLLAGRGPDGLAVLRFRPAIWSDALECYLAELYVVPARRGHGLGRELMVAALELASNRGADRIELGTSEDDVAARALYEGLGFRNREGGSGSLMYFYERELLDEHVASRGGDFRRKS